MSNGKNDKAAQDNRSRTLNRQDPLYWKSRGLGDRAAANEAARQTERNKSSKQG